MDTRVSYKHFSLKRKCPLVDYVIQSPKAGQWKCSKTYTYQMLALLTAARVSAEIL